MKYLTLNKTTFFTTGLKRSLVGNLSTQNYYLIPNSMVEFCNISTGKNLEEIKLIYKDDIDTVDEYINWLLDKKLAIFTTHKIVTENKTLNKIDWEIPYKITNCILEIDNSNFQKTASLIQLLCDANIPHLEIRVFDVLETEQILTLISTVQQSSINSLTLLLQFNANINKKSFHKSLERKTVLNEVIIFNAPHNKNYLTLQKTTNVRYVTSLLSNCSCGVTNSRYFFVNNDFYQESREFNSCLHKKISIDTYGNIKNCPSMRENFGNINNGDSILEVVAKKEFIQLSRITKDKINVCKLCEYRDICMDCRAYTQNPNDSFSKPLKCGYDPSSTTWEDWKKTVDNKAAIKFYNIAE